MQDLALDKVFQQILTANCADKYDEWLFRYCADLTDPLKARRQFSYRRYLVNLANIKPDPNKRVLDAGCGFGPNCICFYLMGFRHIYGIDIYKPMIETMKAYLPVINLERQIIPILGDVADLTNLFPENSFDVILSNEAISHYHDVEAFLRESYALLRPGGALIITDNNNGANPRIRKMNQKIWDAFEKGPPQQIYSHVVKEPYIDKRKKIIKTSFPSLSDAKIQNLADATFRMNEEQIIAALDRYIHNNIMPDSYYRPGLCPLEPNLNQFIENMFNPFKLASDMRKIGFSAKSYSYLGGATRGGIILQLNKLWQRLSPLTLYFSNLFIIIAKK